ncbi:2-amino-4-hydroxy-6-hydroxymethyldihydropteridine diphosphokinase [Panacagrimonas perspica]|uniref:2-amino-4-hydroxy-6-hydroxymethyldihydropteridine pyrophosphokinase n=1 Tax=Panacagrimonas perspica TaxID=381431 RepID=A0A4R7NTU8_9GAMM|nr:2-amino-4-hydroxy-6-hydroxymethyldihydropteridine diphosphokinase [Panacagrimonas perspica]TDU24407.1 2-amino-4-hydroxy-6-hydroxymethyldihydropteridine diphosphokinase [Panacagrimonas perspica]THD01454.1 2-amino-4-hydroxy-6-hydroxymethyldihydropteridine diphosphokinase [Panacagrimonas perspica]
MYSAYVGLGANLGDPAAQLRAALDAIAALDGTRIVATSRFYRSAPMGPPDQPEYCNAVCQVQTALSPRDLLDALIGIERTAGRIRSGERWGPRRLDLDLLHVEGIAMDEPGLHLPHPGIASRNFVLVPLAELAPQLQIPSLEPIDTLARTVGMEGLSAWDALDAPPA